MTKLPTIDIKGSKYTLVKDRILFFNSEYPNGSINTQIISELKDDRIIVRATVIPDCSKPERCFSDYSQEVVGDSYINKTSALENCSTSSIGRALALMGIGVIDSIASVDEINKAQGLAANRTYYNQGNVKKVVKEDEEKIKIKKLCDEIEPNPLKLDSKEAYEIFVKEKTDLDLVKENYIEIINRLIILENET